MEVVMAPDWPWELWDDSTDLELCGLLIGHEGQPVRNDSVRRTYYSGGMPGRVFTVVQVAMVDNSAEHPTNDFAIRRSEIERVKATYCWLGSSIIGAVHTHPGNAPSNPSRNDRRGLPQGWIGAVITPVRNTVRWYTHKEH